MPLVPQSANDIYAGPASGGAAAAAFRVLVADDIPNIDDLNGFPGTTTTYLRGDGTFATLTAAANNAWDFETIKTVDQDVTNSNTLADDNELLFAVTAGSAWVWEFIIVYAGTSSTADYKWDWRVSAGTMTCSSRFKGGNTSASNGTQNTLGGHVALTELNAATGIAAGTGAALSDVRIFTAEGIGTFTSAANVIYRFAQNGTTAANSVRTFAGSRVRGKRYL